MYINNLLRFIRRKNLPVSFSASSNSLARRRGLLFKSAFLLLVLPFLALSYYNQPCCNDDFGIANVARRLGFIAANRHLFLTWSGRFFTNAAFVGLNPLAYGGLNYMGLPVVAMLFLKIATVAWLLRSVSNQQVAVAQATWLAAGLVLLHTCLVPDLYSAVYFFTDSAVYQLPALLLLAVPVAIERAHRAATATKRRAAMLAAIIATVAVAGSNEMTISLLGWLLTVGLLVSIYQKKRTSSHIWLFLLVLLLTVSSLSLRAPGNFARLAVNATPVSGWLPLLGRLTKAVKLLLLSPELHALLLTPLVLAPLGIRLLAYRPAGLRLPLPVSCGLLLSGLIFGCLPYVLVWEPPVPTRAVNVLLWWGLFGWLTACWAALPATAGNFLASSQSLRRVAGAVLVLVVTMTSVRAWQELLFSAPAYLRQWEARYQVFRQAARQPGARVTVPPMIHVQPRYVMIRGYDLQPYYSFLLNQETAEWFGLDSVRTDASQLHLAAF